MYLPLNNQQCKYSARLTKSLVAAVSVFCVIGLFPNFAHAGSVGFSGYVHGTSGEVALVFQENITASGSQAGATFELQNPYNKPIDVRIAIANHSFQGKPSLASKQQLAISPGERRQQILVFDLEEKKTQTRYACHSFRRGIGDWSPVKCSQLSVFRLDY